MKELSIKEKAERYDEIIEGVQEILSSGQDSIKMSRLQLRLQSIFPELKENEDDRIKECIIETLKGYHHLISTGGVTKEDMIAWLEKQGGNNMSISESTKQKLDDNLNKALEKETPKSWDDFFEKQGEQKPFDYENANIQQKDFAPKVEPKFKIGDWIVGNINKVRFLLKSFNSGFCTLEDTEGRIYSPCVPPNEVDYHLWTIQDAKDGDVLVDAYGNIGIFEKRYGINWHTYCYLGNEGRFISEGGSHGSICYPATKEERDTLFTKMKEAGYEWDAEKLKLKKISQRMISAEAKEAMYGNSAWSEEDEDFMYHTLSNLTELKDRFGEEYGNVGKCIEWLKSFKDRYTWKPSELQMECLYDAIKHYQTNGYPASKLNELYEQMSKIYKL